jgi:hypothetical protein
MRTWIAASLFAMALSVAALPAGAHDGGAELQGPLDLGVDLDVGAEGLGFGGRLAGPTGRYRFRLGGRPRLNGFTLEGWLDDGGLTRGFTFDAQITPWWRSRPDTL